MKRRKSIPKKLMHVKDMIFAIKKVKTWKSTQTFVNSLYGSRIKKGLLLSKRQYAVLWDCYDQWIK